MAKAFVVARNPEKESRLKYVAPGFVADLLATVQARYPAVPIVFCETRPLAEEWTFRFLGAALAYVKAETDPL